MGVLRFLKPDKDKQYWQPRPFKFLVGQVESISLNDGPRQVIQMILTKG